MTKFAPRKYFGNTIIFYIFFFVFGIIGLIFLSGILNDIGRITEPSIFGLPPAQSLGLIFLLFSALVILIMSFKNLAIGCYYATDGGDLIISMNWFKKRIPFEKISAINKITSEEVQKLMLDLRQKQLSYNPIGVFQSIKPSINLIKYCTVPITTEQIILGAGKKIQTRLFAKVTEARTSGDFILLIFKDDNQCLLSPKDVDGLIEAIKIHINSV